MRYAVIMAGGSGKRLWPLSREKKPKQCLQLVGGKSLIETAVDRLDGVFEPEQVFIITNAEYADQIREILPQLPAENVIGEPVGRDTSNAIALAAELLAARDESATMAVFTADHIIRPPSCFAKSVERAMDAAEANPGTLVTFGIRPSWPHTGLGYVEAGEAISEGVKKVESFREKPDHATARRYVESGQYYWNSGMFVWTLPTIREAIGRFLPQTAKALAPIHEAAKVGQDCTALIEQAYPGLEKVSIDYGVMEKAESVVVVELNCEWFDLGSWPALEDVCDLDSQGNAIIAGTHVIMDSFRNVLVSSDPDHMLAVLGMDDCIVVHTPDATLVCNKSDHQRLKELVAAIEKHYGKRYL